MKLIDADAFIAKLDHVPMVQEAIRKAMDTMPTIEPEQRTGKWIEPSREGCLTFDYKAFRECSMCGKKQFLAEKMNFCPNCGADMRGET